MKEILEKLQKPLDISEIEFMPKTLQALLDRDLKSLLPNR